MKAQVCPLSILRIGHVTERCKLAWLERLHRTLHVQEYAEADADADLHDETI